jgi:sigma-B regulation protein RsbU (phosphoserine phosphatase)
LKNLAKFLAKLVYGIILPAYLLWFVFFNYYQQQRVELKSKLRDQMEEPLDLLASLHKDNHFFHVMLKKNIQAADHHQEPEKALRNRISALKKNFNNGFKFIVWRPDGNIIDSLSDELQFRYILKSMFRIMQIIFKDYKENPRPWPDSIKEVQQKIKLLRGYFGKFLLPEKLTELFAPGFMGKVTDVSHEPEKRKLWYYIGKNFSVACFIKQNILNHHLGPTKLLQNFNSNNTVLSLGFLATNDYNFEGRAANEADLAKLKLAAKMFEENAIRFSETDKFLALFRQISDDLIALCYAEKKGVLPDPANKANAALWLVFKWLAILAFIVYCYTLPHPGLALNIQQKVLLLLLFANGLPALILISTGYEYFSEKKAGMIEAQQQESIRVLQEFDARFPSLRKIYAQRLNKFNDAQNARFGVQKWNEQSLKELEKLIFELNCSKMYLMDKYGNNHFKHINVYQAQIDSFVSSFLTRGLDFVNNSNIHRRADNGKSTLESMASEDLIFINFTSYLNSIFSLNTALGKRWTYLKQLGDHRNFNSWGFLALIWTPEEMLRLFLKQNFVQEQEAVAPRKLLVMETSSQEVFPEKSIINNRIRILLKQTQTRKIVLHNNLELAGKKYLFAAIAGNEMRDALLIALYPLRLIEQAIWRFKAMLFLSCLLILMVLARIASLFSNRLIAPIRGLSAGFDQIRQNNFRFRVEHNTNDELGELIKAFNSSMQSLQELSLGTAIQESLLPESHFKQQKIELFGKSLFMTKMGGDYFDYFSYRHNKLGIFFGDVAGHGIPAAIIMAMVKAVITANRKSFSGPENLLNQANLVLLRLKERKLRRMMTCQVIDIDCNNGQAVIANAGHCYPAIVSDQGKSVKFIEVGNMPLGTKNRKGYQEITFKLQPGDTLLLYTDGIIEATNSEGEQFGFENFKTLLKTAWHPNLELYWQGIIEANNAWQVEQDDDLTFMLIKYEKQ